MRDWFCNLGALYSDKRPLRPQVAPVGTHISALSSDLLRLVEGLEESEESAMHAEQRRLLRKLHGTGDLADAEHVRLGLLHGSHQVMVRRLFAEPRTAVKLENLRLVLVYSSLTTLNLSDIGTGAAVAAALAASTSLTTLDLSYNGLGDAGAAALAASTSLTTLDLYNNQVGEAGATALAASTSLLTTLV